MWSPTILPIMTDKLLNISIHGLRVEPDESGFRPIWKDMKFQSTGSVWSPTKGKSVEGWVSTISIHGLRVEPDSVAA